MIADSWAEVKMMPGQEPYSDEEWGLLRELIEGACAAEEIFGIDELDRR